MTRSAQPSAIGPQPVCGCSVSSAGAGHGIVSSASICPGAGRGARSAIRNSQSTTGLRRFGFTLVEIAIVFAIIAVLVVVIAMVSTKARTAAKVKQTRAIMESVMMALAEYRMVYGDLPPQPFDPDDVPPPDSPFGFRPLPPGSDQFRFDFFREPNDFPGDYQNDPPARGDEVPAKNSPGTVAYSVKPAPSLAAKFEPDNLRIYGIQALYARLSSEPNSKRVLSKLPPSCLGRGSHKDASDNLVVGSIDPEMGFQEAGSMVAMSPPGTRIKYDPGDSTLPGRVYEALILLDAWGRPMYYDMDNTANNHQPALQSAGPDGLFGTDDDIWSFKK